MSRKLSVVIAAGTMLACAALFAAPLQELATLAPVPDGAVLSAWLEQREVRQIPWSVLVRKPTIRLDLRYELHIDTAVRMEELQKTGDIHDLILFARVLDRGRAITPIHSVTPVDNPIPAGMALPMVSRPPVWISLPLTALAQPGKYKLEIALVDRSTGRYSTAFEDIFVGPKDADPLRRALATVDKFEFAPRAKLEPRESQVGPPFLTFGGLPCFGNAPVNTLCIRTHAIARLDALHFVSTKELPSFVIDRPGTTHLSIVSILSPPERAIGDAYLEQSFRLNLTNLLGVFTRLRVNNGTARFTGVDLTDRTIVFNRRDLQELTPELLHTAIKQDRSAISLGALAGKADNGTFMRNVLKEKIEEAERDTSGAHHVIIVVGAGANLPNSPRLSPIPSVGKCHCAVYYVRFSVTRGDDVVERVLKEYRPQIFEPLDWTKFREDFGKIYEQLQR